MFTVKEFAKLTPMCKNWTIPYWAKPYFPKLTKKIIPCPWNQIRGPPIVLSQCLESNEPDGLLIWLMTIILSHIESHLLQAFRDTCWIPNQGIEWKSCIKKGFGWFMQACLGRFYVGILATHSRLSNMQSLPPCENIWHSLTKKNSSFQNWPN